ncbi:hypothetical protein A9G11_07800 [Gilliamella sp. wkB108]|uniref:hypothetical protein n=1 Tax=Gilliamella sp. wkB108 TaxID=3120256 RepID=UPI00080D9243|nr:hypothetical protein [Gilliamella apicola]OCG21887.1 hypothetical protein A9G11_07800 [Gilliamella apicola]
MELVELLKDNWINLVIIFVLSFIGFFYKKRSKDNYFDNIIRYTDILEKTPQPKYQKDYLNNIKKKLLWEKVCFYKSGNVEKERIAISLVNADVNDIINLSRLNLLTQYFSIKQNQILPVKPFMVKEVIISTIAFFLAFIIIISNINTAFHSPWIVSIIIAILTIFVIAIIALQFALNPIKRFKTYRSILKDNEFLKRANSELANILKDSEEINTNIIEEVIDEEEEQDQPIS